MEEMMGQRNIPVPPKNKKPITLRLSAFSVVGMTRFELATPRPPDAYSNRTELHPETWVQNMKDWVLF